MTVNSKQVKRLQSLTYVAGAAGLEPANGGVKVRCVTASPRPYVVARLTVSRPRGAGTLMRSAAPPFRPETATLGFCPRTRGPSPASRCRVTASRYRAAHAMDRRKRDRDCPRSRFYGVGYGTRTHDIRNHNPALYQLS